MKKKKNEIQTLTFDDIDILGSIGSDLSDGINDFVREIRSIKNDVEKIKDK
ncbi:hypothetical protein KBA27_00675 [bacterium]|nr:hypothetical protein [bacterium]